jgi:hypothetical protein
MLRKIKTLIGNISENEKVDLSLSQGDFHGGISEKTSAFFVTTGNWQSFDKPIGFDYFRLLLYNKRRFGGS